MNRLSPIPIQDTACRPIFVKPQLPIFSTSGHCPIYYSIQLAHKRSINFREELKESRKGLLLLSPTGVHIRNAFTTYAPSLTLTIEAVRGFTIADQNENPALTGNGFSIWRPAPSRRSPSVNSNRKVSRA